MIYYEKGNFIEYKYRKKKEIVKGREKWVKEII